MGAVRAYQFYEKKTAQWEQERIEQEGAFSFDQVPLVLTPPQAERPSRPVPLPVAGQSTDIFLEDAPLPPTEQAQQAQDTIQSILQDFAQEPVIQSFNKDLQQATQNRELNFDALSGGDLEQLLKDNPQIGAVVSKHMQDPDFAKVVQQIFSNPQFVKSVQELQQQGLPAVPTKTNP